MSIASYLLSKSNVRELDKLIAKTPILKHPRKLLVQGLIDYEFPVHIFMELTSACNYLCLMCPRTKPGTLVGHMEIDVIKKIVDEASKYGGKSFSLHGFGEPFMAKNFDFAVKYIKEKHPQNNILLTSNGSRITDDKAKKIVEAGVDNIYISFTSPDRETAIKKVGVDQLEISEKNINNLIRIKKELNSKTPKIYVRLIVDAETKPQTEEFVNRWKDKDVTVELREVHNYGGEIEQRIEKKLPTRHPCYHLWFAPMIHWNGDFSICCDDWPRKAVLGSIKNQSINEIWNSRKIKEFRKLHLSGQYDKMSLCKNCNVWSEYNDFFFKHQKK
ncbi:MAG: hypothetical protein CMI53_03270 [Parcubacteria group bacterium]|jgi:radical SAM protein with 4Fe4S-binding SPASM domain|nr:hypothetical protein [Parcubacteria group bacterium]